MLAAVLVLGVGGSLPELKAPGAFKIMSVLAVGPKGEYAVEVDYKGRSSLSLLKDGELIRVKPLDSRLFERGDDLDPWYSDVGFLPSGEFYGSANCRARGASTDSIPFLTRSLAMHPIEVPKPLDLYEWVVVRSVGADGAVLLEISTQNHKAPDILGRFKSQAVWVRNGRLLQDLGPARDVVIGPRNQLVASQRAAENEKLAVKTLSTYKDPPLVVRWSGNTIVPLVEGEPLAIQSDGGIILSRSKMTPRGDVLFTLFVYREELREKERLVEYKIKDQPDLITAIRMDNRGRGFVQGFTKGKPVIKVFDQFGTEDLSPYFANPAKVELACAREGHFVFRDESVGDNPRFFVYRL